ncbi:hypothetical protein GCM10017771_10730 [Streptomyces capitiformicae]|uniref:Uncharacterized protein n=1 Tax=Streptomyces capitiformicae TaxID=2014920 RepID=A0A919L4X7_9ACTN|nr:hypothetical protein GCM10017771_10730 [Streptomyces capitiformicae]
MVHHSFQEFADHPGVRARQLGLDRAEGSPLLALFGKRLRTAYEMLDGREPGWRENVNASLATTITPLAAGSGLRLGSHGPGALGVAVDFESEEFVRQLPLLGRRARLTALREVVDLHVPGSSAGRLLDEASEQLGTSAARHDAEAPARAGRTLDRLAALAPGELTENGAYFADELTREWTRLHG